MIVIDWGTTNLRAYLCQEDGSIQARFQCDQGIKALSEGDYPAVLATVIDSFQSESHETLFISGMAGARGGWQEIPYATCPVSLSDLADMLTPLPEPYVGYFIGGVRALAADGTTDVMRGEEVQIFGSLQQLDRDDAVLCLPGTHSKWVRTQSGQISDFVTFMTGDIFQALAGTILACNPANPIDPGAFRAGLDAVQKTAGGLLHQLFTVRTRVLEGKLEPQAISAFVSGLLIGHELQQSVGVRQDNTEVAVIGANQLSDLYCRALEYSSLKVIQLGSDVATCTGVSALRRTRREGR